MIRQILTWQPLLAHETRWSQLELTTDYTLNDMCLSLLRAVLELVVRNSLKLGSKYQLTLHISTRMLIPATMINRKPGSKVRLIDMDPLVRTIPPLTNVLAMIAMTMARAAMFRVSSPLPLNSAMERVIASTSARPDKKLEI